MAFDPTTQAALQRYHDELRSRQRRAATTGITAAARTMRGAPGGAELVEQQRGFIEGGIEGRGAWMSQKEKMDRRQALEAVYSGQEQYYHGKAQDERLERFKQQQENWRAITRAREQRYASDVSASNKTAELQSRRLQYEIDQRYRQGRELFETTPEGADRATAAAKELNAALDQAQRQYLQGRISEMAASGQVPAGWQPSKDEVQALMAAMPPETAAAIQDAAFRGQAGQVLADYADDPGQALAILSAIGAGAGISMDRLRAASEGTPVGTFMDIADQELAQKAEALEDEVGELEKQWARASRSGARPNSELDAQLAEFGAYVDKRQQQTAARQEQRAASTTDYLDQGEAPGVVEYDAPDGDFLPDQGENFMGLPVKPASDAQGRTLQMLDLVEKYPDHPPLRQAKDDLMQSSGFQQYKATKGYSGMNDSDVLKEMHREFKHQTRENKREFRQRRKENIETGVSPGRLGSKKTRAPVSKPKAPVAGSGE